MQIDNQLFKKILILFWTLWWLIALCTDVLGELAHLGIISDSWAPHSNYLSLVAALQMYHVPAIIPHLLFCGIILWALLSTLLFCWASVALGQKPDIWMHRAKIAFIVSLSLWLAFFLADQLVFKFDYEESHMVQGGFQFLSFFALYLLPEK